MRLVLDTNIVVSALLWGGRPRLLVEAAQERKIELFTSNSLLDELADVLGRRKFDRKVAAFKLTIGQIMERYTILATVVSPKTTSRIVSDPDDDVVIGTAMAARADGIVSGDAHLLGLGMVGTIRIVSASVAVACGGAPGATDQTPPCAVPASAGARGCNAWARPARREPRWPSLC